MTNKTTIDGIVEVPAEEAEFILGGGGGVIKKFQRALLSPFKRVINTVNFWTNDALHMEHTGKQTFSGDVEFKGVVTGITEKVVQIQSKQIVGLVSLEPTGATPLVAYVPSTSTCFMTLTQEDDGMPAVRYEVSTTGTVNLPATSGNLKTLNLRLKGLLSTTTFAVLDQIDIQGITLDPAQTKFYDYKADLTSRNTNALRFFVAAERKAIQVRCQFKVVFTLPNEDFGLGIPFPDFK